MVSNNVQPGGNFVVLDLQPATWYLLRVTANNNAGYAKSEYDFATLTVSGGTRREGEGRGKTWLSCSGCLCSFLCVSFPLKWRRDG